MKSFNEFRDTLTTEEITPVQSAVARQKLKQIEKSGVKKSQALYDKLTRLANAHPVKEGYVPPERNRPAVSDKDKSTLGRVADLMAKEKAKKDVQKEEVELEEAQYGVNLGSRPVSGQKEYQGKEIKSFHPNKEKEAREFAKKHGYVVKKKMLPAGNSITHTWDIHKEEVELEEAIKLGSKVKVHAPGKDYHGQVGRVGEIRHGAYKGAPKTYTVDYGDSKSVQLDKKNVKLHNEEVEQVDELDKSTLQSYAQKALDDKNYSNRKNRPADIVRALHKIHAKKEVVEEEQIEESPKEGAARKFSGMHDKQEYPGMRTQAEKDKLKAAAKRINDKSKTNEEVEMSQMDKYLAAIAGNADFRTSLEEKTLTPAELKKREEIAQAMERENPGMDMGKKMAIATAQAKKVAEESDTVVKDKEGNIVSWKHEGDWKKTGQKKDPAGKVHHMSDVARRQSEKMAKEETDLEEGKEHTVPKTEKEKDLAAIAEPKDKITHADVLKGRGVTKEGVELDEEQLDEISKETALSYRDKAQKRLDISKTILKRNERNKSSQAKEYDKMSDADKAKHKDLYDTEQGTMSKNIAKHGADVKKREAGIARATSKLTKEGVELDEKQLDELSKDTLNSYVKKANASQKAAGDRMDAHHRLYGDGNDKEFDKAQSTHYKRAMGKGKAMGRGVNPFQEEVQLKTFSQLMAELDEAKKDDYWDFKDLKDEPKSTTRKVAGTRYGGSAQKDEPEQDDNDDKPAEKRGRGRPAGSKSGARH